MSDTELLAEMANIISQAIAATIDDGVDPQNAVNIAASAVADTARTHLDDGYLLALAEIVRRAGERPLPPMAGRRPS